MMSNGYHNGDTLSGHDENGHKQKHKEKRKETEEERRIRKEKERKEKEEKYRKEGKRPETEEERRIRKEKEKERREREEKYKKEGKREETEEERRRRKEKERRDREDKHKKDGKREETEEERRLRKEKERREREDKPKREETEEERRIRKERERKEKEDGKPKHRETEEERRIRKEKERRERKEREAKERDEDESSQDVKDEPMDVKDELEDQDDDMPLAKSGKKRKPDYEEDEDEKDHKPLYKMKKMKEESDYEEDYKPLYKQKKMKEESDYEEEDEDFGPKKKKPAPKKAAPASKQPKTAAAKKQAASKAKSQPVSPTKPGARRGKKEEQPQTVWKWWEEEKRDDGTKWKFLQHKGPLFAPLYEPLPDGVNFYYEGKKIRLTEDAEECATFYAKMLDHDYTAKEVFNKNFFKDWRKCMSEKEKERIRDLSKCNFAEMNAYFKKLSEDRKIRSKEEKKAEKEKNDAIAKEYGICVIDGHEEKVGNFRIEPPGLFRGRGEHPKQGMMKRRVQPEDVIINCSKDSKWPEAPKGHKWKEVRHDNTVTWLASWTENIQNQIKYVMLNPSSRLKGEKDMEKYEKARRLKTKIAKIREDYTVDFKSKEMRIRQRAVALYFIDKLALRAGNEKDEDQADTVGCCSLRVEHITLHEEHEGKEFVVEFDFLGKDSIRYHNHVQVEKRVFKNLQLFMENKKEGDDLFDRLNTSILNEYLSSLMPGLTAKVFRTYNASITLQEQLALLTEEDDNMPAKMLSYNRANRAVAILCNHQRAVPKTHDTSMANLQAKIDKKTEEVLKAEKEYKSAKKSKSAEEEKKRNTLKRLTEQLNRLETQKTDKEENKQIALGTSKLNYLDPRISVAWCLKFEVPLEKVYNKTHREKFRWAIEMTDADYEF